jgi:predicted PurR-regulated permease PerM
VATSEGTVPAHGRRTIRLSPAAGVSLVAAAVLGWLAVRTFVAAHRPLSWAAAAVVAAVLLDPVVDRLAVHIKRVPAVLLCFLVAGGAVLGVAYLVFDDLDRAVGRLQEAAPGAAERIEARDDQVGDFARDLDLVTRVNDAVKGLEDRVGTGGDVIKSTALTAPTYLVGAILTVFLMSYGPTIGGAALEQLPANRRKRVGDVLVRSARRARSAALLTLADCFVVGVLVSLVALLLDLPAPAAVGLVAGLVTVLPHLGIVLGSMPLILLTLGMNSGVQAALVAVGVVALQAFDSIVVRRRINRLVRLGLLAPWIVALLAHAVYGVGAAAYGLAFAAFGLALLDELAADDAPSDGDAPGVLTAPAPGP